MKTFIKVIKYLALALAISIIMGIISAIYYLGDSLSSLFVNEAVSDNVNIFDYDDDVSVLNITIKASKLVIKDGDNLRVESNNKYIKVNNSNNKLDIVEDSHNFVHTNNSLVTVYVPNDMIFDKVYIETGAGSIDINVLSGREIKLDLGFGTLLVNNLIALDKCDIDTGAGKVVINGANVNNLDLDIGSGEFTFNGVMNNNTDIDAGIGKVDINLLDSKDNYSIYVDKGIGSIIVDGQSMEDESIYGNGYNKIEINGGIGSINVSFNE